MYLPLFVFSQCPDAKSNEYKNKAQQYGDPSYTTLATYYYYKCQCQNGIANRTPAQVNALVDQYNRLKNNRASSSNGISLPNQHQVQWVTISKVSKCSNSKKNNNTSTNKKSKEENIKSIKQQENLVYVNAVSSATMNLINKDYQASIEQFTEMGMNGMLNGNERDFYTGVVGTTVSFIAQDIERRRLEKLELERKKRAFQKLVNDYREKVYAIIKKRQQFFIEIEDLKPTVTENGNDFKPIYLYFSYTNNNYDNIKEDIKFPDKLDVNFNENCEIYFSPVYAVFPYSNGEYPSLKEIKSIILKMNIEINIDRDKIEFFPWKKSINGIVSDLQKNIVKSVNEYSFTKATPSKKKEVQFILRKKTNNNSHDYWTDKKINKKDTININYWKNEN